MFKKLFKLGGENPYGKTKTMFISIIGIILIIIGWYGITKLGIISPKILPNPIDVIKSYKNLIFEYDMLSNAWYSIKLNLISYVYAIGISLPLGLFIALYPINNIIVGKYINSVRYLPIPALSGILIAIFGLTFDMKVSFLAFSLIIYILPAVANKVNDLHNPHNDKDYVYVQTIKTLGANNWQRFKYVYWPYVTRTISTEIITLTGISWSYICICELLYKDGSINGIGAMINTMTRQSNMPEVYALLIAIVAIGIMQDIIFKGLDKLLFPSKYNLKRINISKLFVK